MKRYRRIACAAIAVAAVAAPASAQQPAQPSPADRQRAAVLQAYGGAFEGPLAIYVARVGERMAVAAGQAGRCRFTILDTPVVNAMATPPGCEVYITRGLLGLIRDEDELAAVLGHEVGHVAANHAGRRQTRSAVTGLGALILGAVTGSSAVASIAGQVGQLNVLSYSREQEFEADRLSARYLANARYSPFGLSDMLSALQANDQVEALDRAADAKATPAWSRTHPLTGDRIARAADAARRTAGPAPPAPAPEAGPYLAMIDGLIYGDDPREGVVIGRRFIHPQIGVGFTAPEGFQLANGPSAVTLQAPGSLVAQFAGPVGSGAADLAGEAYAVLRQAAGEAQVYAAEPQRTRINGLDAVILPAQARSTRGSVDVVVAVYGVGSRAYHFIGLAPAGQGGAFDPLIGSMRRLDDAERAEARPRRIRVVNVKPGDTVQGLAARMETPDRPLERFEAINGLQPGDSLHPGERVKIVAAD